MKVQYYYLMAWGFIIFISLLMAYFVNRKKSEKEVEYKLEIQKLGGLYMVNDIAYINAPPGIEESQLREIADKQLKEKRADYVRINRVLWT